MAPRKEVRARRRAEAERRGGGGAGRGAGATASADAKGAGPARRRRRLFWMGVVAVAVVGIAFLGAFPARTYFRQQSSTARAESELGELDTEIATLQTQIGQLQTDSEIEARARADYHMTRPGEEAVALLPAPPPPIEVPSGWPYSRLFSASR